MDSEETKDEETQEGADAGQATGDLQEGEVSSGDGLADGAVEEGEELPGDGDGE